MKTILNILFALFISICFTQEIITEFLIVEEDTVDIFSYQIPNEYNSSYQHPLLIAFHQWGGNENSTYYTTFDEEANNRNWFFMSPYGGSSNNYNHQEAQQMIESEIKWMINHYNINEKRIYMVGGSMGGASGMIYSNNHLNPTMPMIAATASGSGILDCERRAIEMDGNNSMIEWFGGNWDEVPFEYHRNSAIYFNDFSQSMHFNLKHLAIYLDFGTSEPHRIHAEEMHQILIDYNDNMWIDINPTGSHGFSVMDEEHTCDWLSQFELVDNPDDIHVNLDEPSRAYYVEALNQIDSLSFININMQRESDLDVNTYNIHSFLNSDSLLLHILNNNFESFYLNLNTGINKLGITGQNLYNSNEEIFNFNAEAIDTESALTYELVDNILWISPNDDTLNFIGSYFFEIQIDSQLEGDVNQDQSQNVQDIILIINHIIGNNNLNGNQIQIADINNDGGLNVMDVILLVNIIISD